MTTGAWQHTEVTKIREGMEFYGLIGRTYIAAADAVTVERTGMTTIETTDATFGVMFRGGSTKARWPEPRVCEACGTKTVHHEWDADCRAMLQEIGAKHADH